MHPDLVAISNLWQADAAMDRLKAEIETLIRNETRGAELLASTTAAETTAAAALAAHRDKVRANERDLDAVTRTRDNTRRMIDAGTAPNYAAAERQLAQTTARADQLETEGLELLDTLDTLTREARATQEEREKAQKALAAAREARAAREAAARAELLAAAPHQAEMAKALPLDWRSQYAELRRKRRPALVNVDDGVCVTCQTLVPAHRTNEVRLGRAVHTCAGCGGFLLP